MPERNRRAQERVAIFDVDNTLSRNAVFFPWVDAQVSEGFIKRNVLQDIEIGKSQFSLLQKSLEHEISGASTVLDQDRALVEASIREQEIVATRYEALIIAILALQAKGLEGQRLCEIEEHANEFFAQARLYRPCMKPMVDALRDTYGFKRIIATALPDIAAIAIANYFKINSQYSTSYQTQEINGESYLTGELEFTLATAGSRCSIAIAQTRDIPRDSPTASILAFDDSIAGVGMLFVADRFDGAFCVDPSPQLQKTMNECGWREIPPEELEKPEIPTTLQNHLLTL